MFFKNLESSIKKNKEYNWNKKIIIKHLCFDDNAFNYLKNFYLGTNELNYDFINQYLLKYTALEYIYNEMVENYDFNISYNDIEKCKKIIIDILNDNDDESPKNNENYINSKSNKKLIHLDYDWITKNEIKKTLLLSSIANEYKINLTNKEIEFLEKKYKTFNTKLNFEDLKNIMLSNKIEAFIINNSNLDFNHLDLNNEYDKKLIDKKLKYLNDFSKKIIEDKIKKININKR